MEEPPFLSVIIPTYNRASLLGKNIPGLLNQSYPKSKYEILIIDNASTDNTKGIIENLIIIDPLNIFYLFEPTPGSNFARNTGASKSRGDVLVFLDDDAYADSSWLFFLSKPFIDNKRVVGACGKIELDWEFPKPDWVPEKYESYLGRNCHLGLTERELSPSEVVFEGNLAIRKCEFCLAGGFDTNFGMVGNKIGANDGKTLIDQMHKLGKVIYQPEAIIYHHVPASKIQPAFFLKRGFYQGIADVLIAQTRQPRTTTSLPRTLLIDSYFLMKETSFFLMSLFKFSRKQSLEKLIAVFNRLGVIKKHLQYFF